MVEAINIDYTSNTFDSNIMPLQTIQWNTFNSVCRASVVSEKTYASAFSNLSTELDSRIQDEKNSAVFNLWRHLFAKVEKSLMEQGTGGGLEGDGSHPLRNDNGIPFCYPPKLNFLCTDTAFRTLSACQTTDNDSGCFFGHIQGKTTRYSGRRNQALHALSVARNSLVPEEDEEWIDTAAVAPRKAGVRRIRIGAVKRLKPGGAPGELDLDDDISPEGAFA